MILRRRWLDAEGQPHTELATWLPAAEGDERARALEIPEGVDLIEGSPEELARPLLLAALADPAAEIPAGSSGLYEAPLREGARLASAEEHDAATAAAADALEAARADVAAQLAAAEEERQAPRRAALTKLAEAADLSPEELAALLGEES